MAIPLTLIQSADILLLTFIKQYEPRSDGSSLIRVHIIVSSTPADEKADNIFVMMTGKRLKGFAIMYIVTG